MTKEVKLHNGMMAMVDDEDFERVNQYEWAVKPGSNDSILRIYNSSVKETTISLNRFILNLESELKVFHKDGDELNFTKKNLIVVDQGIITRKRRGNRNSSSKYKGVSWNKNKGMWAAQINVNNKVIVLGYFENEDDAAKTYNKSALELFGEHAYQNVIGEDNSAKTFKVDKVSQRRKRNKLGYKGVAKKEDKYQAKVWDGKKGVYAGISHNVKEAAKMYDRKAYELFGDKAVLNFPELVNEYRKA